MTRNLQRPTLVLNRLWQPIHVATVARALVLLWNESARVVDEKAKSDRRRFAQGTKAQEFADLWRRRLWEEVFEHPDPVHNRPSATELAAIENE